jgi:hypothetical protein
MQSESTPDANKQILRRTNCTDWACSSPRIAMTDTLLDYKYFWMMNWRSLSFTTCSSNPH